MVFVRAAEGVGGADKRGGVVYERVGGRWSKQENLAQLAGLQ